MNTEMLVKNENGLVYMLFLVFIVSMVLVFCAKGIALANDNSFEVLYTILDAEESSDVGLQHTTRDFLIKQSGERSYKMAPVHGTSAAVWKSLPEPIDLSMYSMDELALSFWVYVEDHDTDIQFLIELSSSTGSSWAPCVRWGYVPVLFRNEMAPETGKWHHIVLSFSSGQNLGQGDEVGVNLKEITRFRIFQTNSTSPDSPAHVTYIDNVQIVKLPDLDPPALEYPVVYEVGNCNQTKGFGFENASLSVIRRYAGAGAFQMKASPSQRSTIWSDVGGVQLSSVFYNFEDLALVFWLYTEEADLDCNIHVWLGSDQSNDKTLTWNLAGSSVLPEPFKWTPVLLKFQDAVNTGFDWTNYVRFGFRVTSTEKPCAVYIDEINIVSLVDFETEKFWEYTIDSDIAIGDEFELTCNITNSIHSEALTGWKLKLLSSAVFQIEAVDYSDLNMEIDLEPIAPGETKTVTVAFKALEGGTGAIQAMLLTDTGIIAGTEWVRIAIEGKGFYTGDAHTHSTMSDGTGTLFDNFLQAYSLGQAFIIATDHDANVQTDVDVTSAFAELNEFTGGVESFIALKGTEISPAYGHLLAFNTKTVYTPPTTAQEFQKVIDSVKAEGGLTFVAHPFLPFPIAPLGLYSRIGMDNPMKIHVISGFTGVEVLRMESKNSDSHVKGVEFWDRMNIKGEQKYFGLGNTDAHDAYNVGIVANRLLLDSLTEENIYEALGSGAFYCSDGPELRFTLGGANMGETVYVNGPEAKVLSIRAFSPVDAGTLERVVLYKYEINPHNNDEAYRDGQKNKRILYDDAGGQEKLYYFELAEEITVNPGEFYRIEVYTRGHRYNGLAFSNPIWVLQEGTELIRVEQDHAVSDEPPVEPKEQVFSWSADTAVEERIDFWGVKDRLCWTGDGVKVMWWADAGELERRDINGVTALANVKYANIQYAHVFVDSPSKHGFSGKRMEITLEYLDTSDISIGMVYYTEGKATKGAQQWFRGEGTGEWKSFTFTITDMELFELGQVAFDFRIQNDLRQVQDPEIPCLIFRKITVRIFE